MSRFADIVKDERGVSLPLALFLFMICALLAAVVLAAGTTVIGQHANEADSNQRYYAVSSAAQMFSDVLDGQSVTVSVQKSSDVTFTVHYSDGEVTSKDRSESNVSYSLTIDGKDADSEDLTLLEQTTCDLLGILGSDADAQSFWNGDFSFVGESFSTQLNIDHSMTRVPSGYQEQNVEKALKVVAMERLNADGSIVFTFENASSTSNEYAVELAMDADTQLVEESSESQPEITQNETEKMETRHVVDTKNFVITWRSLGISKAGE